MSNEPNTMSHDQQANSQLPSTTILPRKAQWLILSILLLVLYRDVLFKWAIDLWNDDNYSHGLLIPFISLYFIKARYTSLKQAGVYPNNSGLLIVLAGLVLFILGSVGAEFFSQRLSLIVVLYGLISFLEGRETTGILRFPVLLLFFAVPLPYILYDAAAFPLKLYATKIAVNILALFGMPVFREGNIVHLPHTTLEVVDACSGIRSLMTLITLAFLLAYMMHKSTFKRLLIMVLAIPIAVLANAGRVALNGILTKYNPAWGQGFWHEFSGLMVFVLSFVALWGISFLMGHSRKSTTITSGGKSEGV
ncbi:MAG: exosortase/archaeosortase family protein [Proteobacteria bacterium]|nr:exosortase/archaeosortase family protein [Pseudomonadota bacterium]